ncbi:Phytanoyl-CoA dioxygenase (plasmid) [Gemmatirosa kalamazoonensis]|uniref:Phytanoyl-CoA dioxygenase n=1 Tax=Gemmatirosa kalamazoonensis TaxID=861299 RepID=W0RVC7_9BACT|nr:phytanoyl-CoA dioxygenase family protein [Gemmatirosa kalamazoonensis]AHG93538.1 Phytanoyl-CoA dioxygenase [Gemmatirosa kalamazoonensis]
MTLARDGYVIVPDAVDAATVDALLAALAPLAETVDGTRGGARHLLRDVHAVRALARSAAVRGVAEAALGPGAFAVRGILFDKTPGANWKVVWHQDLTIAVRERRDVPGFGPWTEKDGVAHVQPPAQLLARMVAVRVHLDDCTEANGPVRVIPGSHVHGRLTAADVGRWRATAPQVVCTVTRGGILAFHSLLLHASAPAVEPAHRRVVHLEFAAAEWAQLPGGLAWYDRV